MRCVPGLQSRWDADCSPPFFSIQTASHLFQHRKELRKPARVPDISRSFHSTLAFAGFFDPYEDTEDEEDEKARTNRTGQAFIMHARVVSLQVCSKWKGTGGEAFIFVSCALQSVMSERYASIMVIFYAVLRWSFALVWMNAWKPSITCMTASATNYQVTTSIAIYREAVDCEVWVLVQPRESFHLRRGASIYISI